MGTLEDPDEGRLIHMVKKKEEMKLYQFDAKEEKCDSKTVSCVETLFFEKAARAYYRNHINIACLFCCVS